MENNNSTVTHENQTAGDSPNKKKFANPAPLGLLAFGITTLLLNLHNAGLFELNIAIAAMGFALGGLAQFVAGLMEFKRGNTFGTTAFTAYGMFWWSLVIIWWNPFGLEAASGTALGFYFLLWCLFTAGMFIGTLKHSIISRIVFGSLTVLFLLLSIHNFAQSDVVLIIAGVVGIFCGLSAMYNSLGLVINNEFKKDIMPLI